MKSKETDTAKADVQKPEGSSQNLSSLSPVVSLTEMGIDNPACSCFVPKTGYLYTVWKQAGKMILKVYAKQEDTREIDNYLLLQKLAIPALPLLGYTKNAILLPQIPDGTTCDGCNDKYRLGNENDLGNPTVARAIAKWYRILHTKGREYLCLTETKRTKRAAMYDESDVITADNMHFVAEKTGTQDNALWKPVFENFTVIRKRIDGLPCTLTYNDFYYTNLIVANDCQSAFMFDYNLLGKGMAYGDVRNVTSSLSPEAAEAFLAEYDISGLEDENAADAFLSPLINLYFACCLEEFPFWAEDSLASLKNGNLLSCLNAWL